jgi:hypothetical protein
LTVFPLWHVALTALIAAGASFVLLRWRFPDLAWREAILVSIVVFVSVAGWRLAGNVGPLNDDPIPPVSPNDVLAPIATYVLLGVYGGFRHPPAPVVWDRVRAWLAVVSFVVNVVVI